MPNSYHVKLFKLIHSVPPYVYWRIKIGLYNVNFGPFIIIFLSCAYPDMVQLHWDKRNKHQWNRGLSHQPEAIYCLHLSRGV